MESSEISITLAGRSFSLKAPPLEVLNALGRRYLRMKAPSKADSAKFFVDLVYRSLRQTYPTIDRGFVRRAFDLGNITQATQAFHQWIVDADASMQSKAPDGPASNSGRKEHG